MNTIPNQRMADGDVRTTKLTNHNSDWFLDLLKLWLPPNSRVLELGTARGVSARRFATMFPLGQVITCDKSTDQVNQQWPGNVTMVQGDFIANGGAEVKSRIPGSSDFDLVYHDAVHGKDEFLAELRNFDGFGKRMVGGHDYTPIFPCVIEAVCEYFGQPPHFVLGDGSWFYFTDR